LTRNVELLFYPADGSVSERESRKQMNNVPEKSVRTDSIVLAECTADVLAPQAKRQELATSPSRPWLIVPKGAFRPKFFWEKLL